jgi:exopolyphosphatase/guanosine-5'-triphosphate,3'-diphosphate pyrophosphatase
MAQDGARTFYPVGGAWRNLARIHMNQCGYPLHVVHGYRVQRADIEDLSRMIGELSPRSLGRVQGVTKRRLETLPVAALVLGRVIAALGCRDVTFSAFGLREGHAYSLLTEAERARDPLIAVAEDIATREARFDDLGRRLAAWTDPLFPDEDAADRRLRLASCFLSDIAWREHPDYRAVQALRRILHFPFMGIGHAERVFLGYAAFTRYGGAEHAKKAARYAGLMAPQAARKARVLGLAQRLAYRVSGATRAVLARSALDFDGEDELRLILPDDGTAPRGAAVERRFQALATALGAKRATIEG